MAADFASAPAMREPLGWRREKLFCCGTITATGWAIACRPVPREPLLLRSGKPLPTMRKAVRKNKGDKAARDAEEDRIENRMENRSPGVSRLRQWPVQIKLAPLTAPYFQNSALLIAADCTAYAYGNFHEDFIRDRAVLVGCPKLDNVDYSEKLTEILKQNDIKNLTVVRMEVPCCRGIERAVAAALEKSGKALPVRTVVVGTDGSLCQTLTAAV